MSRKKIVFIIASLYGHGGTTRVATLLANELSSHHAIIILSRYSHSNTFQLDSDVTDIKYTGNTLYFLLKCKDYIYNNKPDIVIIHTMSKLTPALLAIGIKANNIWSFEHTSYEFHKLTYKLLRRFIYFKLNKAIVLSERDERYYRSITNSVALISNPSPLPLTKYDYKNTSKTIITLGRLTYEKGYDILIKAWSIVEQSCPDWSLHIYGEGENRYKLEQLVTKKNIKNLAFKGLTDEVQDVYDNAAFYVMSSRFEGFGMVLIEAQSRGLPIVSFDCPSGPAAIVHHNIDGLLVDNGNTLALAESMIKLIKDASLRKDMSKQALKAAQSYRVNSIIQSWLNLIENPSD